MDARYADEGPRTAEGFCGTGTVYDVLSQSRAKIVNYLWVSRVQVTGAANVAWNEQRVLV